MAEITLALPQQGFPFVHHALLSPVLISLDNFRARTFAVPSGVRAIDPAASFSEVQEERERRLLAVAHPFTTLTYLPCQAGSLPAQVGKGN